MRRDVLRWFDLIRSGLFFLLRGVPSLVFLSILSLVYLALGTAAFLHDFFGVFTAENVLLGEGAIGVKQSVLLLFLCHFFLLGTLLRLFRNEFYDACYFEKISLVRLLRFERNHIENNAFFRFLNHLEHLVYLELFGFLFWFVARATGFPRVSNLFVNASVVGKAILLVLYIPAFIHYTWAFPIMFYYLLWVLRLIVDNSVGRLRDYLLGWEYNRLKHLAENA